jgi:hypothetical protein
LERFTTDSGHQHREAERDYHAALLGDSGVREEMSEAAYRHYMHAILMLWDFERALQESQCAQKDYCKALMNCADAVSIERAQSAYVQQLKVAWTPEIAANCVDSYNEHVQILANAWTMAQRSVQPAHRDYLQAVQKAWARIDTSEIDHDCLAEIAKYMTAVAQHPIFGAVRWHSSAPTFHRVAGEEL